MKTRTLFLTLLTCLCACTNYRDEISELHKEIDSIRDEKISTIDEQVKNIQVSITELEKYKTGLEGYIKDLQEQDKLLKEAIEEAKSSIKDNADDISCLDGKVSQSEAAISALETRLSSVEGALTTLQSLYESLDGKIASLKEYVDEELSKFEGGVKEWANATFCTLEQYYGVTDAITAINSSITLINTSLAEMENSISDLDEKLSAEIDSKLASAISTAKAELETSWKEDIEAASTALESSLKAWVNSQLEGYYTAAETDAKLTLVKQELERELVTQQESLERQIEDLEALVENNESENADTLAAIRSRISSLQQKLDEVTKSNEESIASLRSDLIKVKQALTVEYQSAIETAITENNGLIDNKMATAISNANSSLASQISGINSDLEALVGRVAALETQVADIKSDVSGLLSELNKIKDSLGEILSRIQSVTVVPDYSDGSVNAYYGTSTMDFEIFPLSSAQALAENWSSAISLRAVYTEPVTKASHTYVDFPVNNVSYSDGVVTVKYNSTDLSDEFWDESATVNVRLLISDGNNNITSQYYLLRPAPYENLSANGTANCYIVPREGIFCIEAVKGNSGESLSDATSAEVVWETLNSSVQPSVGDIVRDIELKNGKVCFRTTGKKGNSLIAVLGSSNTILWSWHIWSTDYNPDKEFDVYSGHEDIRMMNRNLGALDSAPGKGSIGLIYEWGRKDPFMGSSSLTSYVQFGATGTFPDCKTSSSTIGTEQYALENPTQYIIANSQNKDWLYTSNNQAWSSVKSINDPCPAGWKVPDGGPDCVWSSFPSTMSSTYGVTWDSTNRGISVSSSLSSNPAWYPAQGYHGDSSTFSSGYWQVGSEGRYWTTHTMGMCSDYFVFKTSTIDFYHTSLSTHFSRANGMPVRCCSE